MYPDFFKRLEINPCVNFVGSDQLTTFNGLEVIFPSEAEMIVAGDEAKNLNWLHTKQASRLCLSTAVTGNELISTENPTDKTESRNHRSITRTTLSACISCALE